MDSALHSQFTGEPARIDAKAGGAFTCYGDYINGITLELEPGKRIAQAWRSRNWPAGFYSIVTFALTAKMGLLSTPIKGTVEVTDRDITIDADLGILERMIPAKKAQELVTQHVRGLLK